MKRDWKFIKQIKRINPLTARMLYRRGRFKRRIQHYRRWPMQMIRQRNRRFWAARLYQIAPMKKHIVIKSPFQQQWRNRQR